MIRDNAPVILEVHDLHATVAGTEILKGFATECRTAAADAFFDTLCSF